MSLGRRWKNNVVKKMLLCGQGAQLPHVSQQLRQLPAAKGLHGQEKLHSLEISELVTGQQHLLHLIAGRDVKNHKMVLQTIGAQRDYFSTKLNKLDKYSIYLFKHLFLTFVSIVFRANK